MKCGWEPLFSSVWFPCQSCSSEDLGPGRVCTDDHYSSHKGSHTEDIEARVDVCSVSFLFLRGCGLDDEDGLDEEEDSGGLEELRGH